MNGCYKIDGGKQVSGMNKAGKGDGLRTSEARQWMTRTCEVRDTQRSFQSQPANTLVSLITYRPLSMIMPDPEDEVALIMAPRGGPEGGRERGATMTPEADFAMVADHR